MPFFTPGRLGALLTMTAAFCFAGKTILAKLAYREGMDPLSLLCLRMIIAGSVFACILLANVLRGRWHPAALPPSKWALVALLGVFGYYLCSYLDFSGLYYIDASLGRMILFLYPTVVVIIDSVLSRSPAGPRTWTALAASYAGLLMMMAPHVTAPGPGFLKGCGLIFLSAVIYAFYLTGVDRNFSKAKMPMLISVTMMVSVASVVIHYGALRDFASLLTFSGKAYLFVIILSVFSTVIPIYAMSAGIAILGASKAAMYNMTGPVMTLLMGAALLGERFGPLEFIGMAMIILGVSRVGGPRPVTKASPTFAEETPKTFSAAADGSAQDDSGSHATAPEADG
ncbi:MAG: DMT family transporter [Deltaproteobacteria bacterium]|jgi:drug/metabolite transporter (DMT)-like permease|nr:DMT family transporter [Deltaproteobacteria bacterium]